MTPPEMAGWNLALRFGLELAALAAISYSSWTLASGNMRWVLAIGLPILAAIAWGTFNVLNDPSRSGEAPVEVVGWIRLVVELMVLFGGVVALAFADKINFALVLGILIVFHYAVSWSRIVWLIKH